MTNDFEKRLTNAELEDKLKNNPIIKELHEIVKKSDFCNSIFLTGGAIIDIIEDREPKDYDIVVNSGYIEDILYRIDKINEISYRLKFLYSSATSFTYMLDNKYKIQILKFDSDVFLFTIEQSKYSLKNNKLHNFCSTSFNDKILIPNDEAYNREGKSKVRASAFKSRIKKWESKGFTIPNITKKSYLKKCIGFTLFGKVINNPIKGLLNNDDEYDIDF